MVETNEREEKLAMLREKRAEWENLNEENNRLRQEEMELTGAELVK